MERCYFSCFYEIAKHEECICVQVCVRMQCAYVVCVWACCGVRECVCCVCVYVHIALVVYYNGSLHFVVLQFPSLGHCS